MYKIYGFESCPYCKKAVGEMELMDADYTVEYIEDKEARSKFLDDRGFTGNDRTFPRVYEIVRGEEVLVGGYTDLAMHLLVRATEDIACDVGGCK